MIKISEIFKISLHSLRKNKFRTFLTMLGIIIGIASIIIIMSAGQGAKSLIVNQIESIGTNLVSIMPGASEEDGPPASVMGIVITTLKNDDLKEIKKRVSEVEAISGYVKGTTKINRNGLTFNTNFTGVSEDYVELENVTDKIKIGRFFTIREEESLSKLAVIGSTVKDNLFPSENPLGKTIKIKKNIFRIIGVIEPRGTEGFTDQDNQIFIPLKTAQKNILGTDYISAARAKINVNKDIDLAVKKIRQVLREQHNIELESEEDFTIRQQSSAIDSLSQIMQALSLFLAAIGGISLLVGGIGIMNIMLVSVNQRFQEIGLRKAIGAKNNDILLQFLIEAIVLTLLGAIIGIIIGVGISAIIAFIATYLGYEWSFVITTSSVLISCFISIIIGIIFGVNPAYKASKLNSIEALRYE